MAITAVSVVIAVFVGFLVGREIWWTPTPAPPARSGSGIEPTVTSEPAPSTGGEFPSASTTGVPAGVELTSSGGLRITEDGAVIDALHIKGGVKVEANNVTIRRSLIDSSGLYPVQVVNGYSGLVIEDSEIDGNGAASVAVLRGGYTLRRVDIHSVKDGPRIEGDNVVIEDSYVHDLTRVEGGHHDTLQIRKGRNIVIRGNNLQAYKESTNDPMNAALQIGSMLGELSGLVVEGNLMNGGNYTVNAGSSYVQQAVYRHNRFGRDFRYAPVGNLGGGSVWEQSNVWHDTERPVTS